jgi:hypothetical protein
MEKKKKKISSTGSGLSARDKMMKRKKDLESRGSGGGLIFPKEGTTRLRILSPGDDEELGIEIIQFYLGPDLGGAISPATFDEPCPFMEKYKELKESSDEDDKALAKLLVPKTRYILGGVGYKDDKGKEIDPDRVKKGFLVPRSVYQDVIDLYLDSDEWGDMTHPTEGYDIKINRSGKGKNDTSYSVSPCQKKPLAREYRGNIDLEAIVRKQIKSYDELEELLSKFLKVPLDNEDEDEDRPVKKKVLGDKKKKKKKKVRDI